MTNQEAFNLIWERSKDAVRAYDESRDRCFYRAPDGSKCFVGALIPNEMYVPAMEYCGIGEMQGLVPALTTVSNVLLRRAQVIHDGENPGCWEEELRMLAANFGLEVPNG